MVLEAMADDGLFVSSSSNFTLASAGGREGGRAAVNTTGKPEYRRLGRSTGGASASGQAGIPAGKAPAVRPENTGRGKCRRNTSARPEYRRLGRSTGRTVRRVMLNWQRTHGRHPGG